MKKIINVVDDDDVVRYACFGRVIMSGRALFESRELAEDNPRLGRTDLETVSRKQSWTMYRFAVAVPRVYICTVAEHCSTYNLQTFTFFTIIFRYSSNE